MLLRIALSVCVLSLAACGAQRIASPVIPGQGLLYTSYKAPVQVNFNATPRGSKHGEGIVTYLREPLFTQFDVAFGDASVAKAASSAGITTIHYTDYEVLSILGVYVQFKLHVYGD